MVLLRCARRRRRSSGHCVLLQGEVCVCCRRRHVTAHCHTRLLTLKTYSTRGGACHHGIALALWLCLVRHVRAGNKEWPHPFRMPKCTPSMAALFPWLKHTCRDASRSAVAAIVKGEKGGDDRIQWVIDAKTDDTTRSTVLDNLRVGYSHRHLLDIYKARSIEKKSNAIKKAGVAAAPAPAPQPSAVAGQTRKSALHQPRQPPSRAQRRLHASLDRVRLRGVRGDTVSSPQAVLMLTTFVLELSYHRFAPHTHSARSYLLIS